MVRHAGPKPKNPFTPRKATRPTTRGRKGNENPDLHHFDVVLVDGGNMRTAPVEPFPAGGQYDLCRHGWLGNE